MRERKETVTLKATAWEVERWRSAASFVGRDLPAFLSFAVSTTARYLRDLGNRRRPDAVLLRQEEKRKLGALLQAARVAVDHLPTAPVQQAVYGPLDVRGNLRRAVDAVDAFLRETGEEYPCG